MKAKILTIPSFLLAVLFVLSTAFFWPEFSSTVKGEPSEDSSESAGQLYELVVDSSYVTVWRDGVLLDTKNAVLIEEGTDLVFKFTKPVAPSVLNLDYWIFTSSDGTVEKENPEEFHFIMPASFLTVDVELKEDEERIASSEEESESESIRASEEEERLHYHYGGYSIARTLESATPPAQFILAMDSNTFSETVQGFYSTIYRIFVYWAKKDGGYNYYVNDPIGRSLIPFVNFIGYEGKTYIVSSPASEEEIPGEYVQSVQIVTAIRGEKVTLPASLIRTDDEEEIILLYLYSNDGQQDFYVYDEESGLNGSVRLSDYHAEKPSTEEPPQKDNKDSENPNFNLWLLVLGIVLGLLLCALVVILILTHKDEKRRNNNNDDISEDDVDSEYEEEIDDAPLLKRRKSESEEKKEASDYSSPDPDVKAKEEKEFDVSFENAFPEEIADIPDRITGEDTKKMEFEDMFRKNKDAKNQ